MEKDLRTVCFYFTSNGGDDYTSIDDVDINDLSFNLLNGQRQKWLEFKPNPESYGLPASLINLDNVTCIVVSPKKKTLEEQVEENVPDSIIERLFRGDFFTAAEKKMKAWEAFESLSEREKKVISKRFGFYGNFDERLEDVAKCLSVTRERVRQIEMKAITKMRTHIYGSALTSDPFAEPEED